jgi:hypothetical protein
MTNPFFKSAATLGFLGNTAIAALLAITSLYFLHTL